MPKGLCRCIHHAALDDDALHAATGLGVDELPRGAVEGKVGDIVEVDEDQVGPVARPSISCTVVMPQRRLSSAPTSVRARTSAWLRLRPIGSV